MNSREDKQLLLPEKKKIITNLTPCISELIAVLSSQPEYLYKISPRRFEELVAYVFSKNGFEVELTKQTKDGGKDIIAIRSDFGFRSKFIIECKRYAKHRPVPVSLVRQLYGTQMNEGANKSVLVTSSYFSAPAKQFVSKLQQTMWAMDLKDSQDVMAWIKNIRP